MNKLWLIAGACSFLNSTKKMLAIGVINSIAYSHFSYIITCVYFCRFQTPIASFTNASLKRSDPVMRILFITTAHNSLSQRAYVELTDRGHEVSIQLSLSQEHMINACNTYQPDLIIAPFLKEFIPDCIWTHWTCLIVHPGIKGDRGPSSLDWAILHDKKTWGVTVLEASAEMDAGDIWSSNNFPMRTASKSAIYRHEVCDAAIVGLLDAVDKYQLENFTPEPLDYAKSDVIGRLHQPMKQAERSIDWSASTEEIARKIRSADSHPGVLDEINGEWYYLYGAHEEDILTGAPGEIIAKRDGAICRATGDGAVWISHIKKKSVGQNISFKLPATQVLGSTIETITETPLTAFTRYPGRTFQEIRYEEVEQIGYLYFDFYNGAMSTEQCQRLTKAYLKACQKPTKVLVLMGGHDFWSNGIHLNVIEASNAPCLESWRNINAINDFVKAVITTDNKITVSVMRGNAAAGGVILALAADYVFARDGIVLNPHYKKMGLYGSEYWTYLLPKRVGRRLAKTLTDDCLTLSTKKAKAIGLIDQHFDSQTLLQQVSEFAETLVLRSDLEQMIAKKIDSRRTDENKKALEQYRKEELDIMRAIFYDYTSTYHGLRKQFVYKLRCDTNETFKQERAAVSK